MGKKNNGNQSATPEQISAEQTRQQQIEAMQQAYELIEQNKQARVQACAQELQALMEKYGCAIEVDLERSGPGFLPKITLVAQ